MLFHCEAPEVFCRLNNFTWLPISMEGEGMRFYISGCTVPSKVCLFVCLFRRRSHCVHSLPPRVCVCVWTCTYCLSLSDALWASWIFSVSHCVAPSLSPRHKSILSSSSPWLIVTLPLSLPTDTHFKMLLSVTHPSILLLPLSGLGGGVDVWVAFFSSAWKWLFIITINVPIMAAVVRSSFSQSHLSSCCPCWAVPYFTSWHSRLSDLIWIQM